MISHSQGQGGGRRQADQQGDVPGPHPDLGAGPVKCPIGPFILVPGSESAGSVATTGQLFQARLGCLFSGEELLPARRLPRPIHLGPLPAAASSLGHRIRLDTQEAQL